MKNRKLLLIMSLIVTTFLSSTACDMFRKQQTICEYPEEKCLYFSTQGVKKYKYSDYIIDDISEGGYLLATPSQADYRKPDSMELDLDAYVAAKFDFELKKKIIDEHPDEVKSMCNQVNHDYYEETNHKIYFENTETHKVQLLHEGVATNVTCNDKTPIINFNIITEDDFEIRDEFRKYKMLLSDIIITNSNPSDYLNTIFRFNKPIVGYYKEMKIDDNAKNNENNEYNEYNNDMSGDSSMDMSGMMPNMMPESAEESETIEETVE